jgi:hypothetical protein
MGSISDNHICTPKELHKVIVGISQTSRNKIFEPAVVVYDGNPSTQEVEGEEDGKFQASLGYIVRLCLKKCLKYTSPLRKYPL